jgi:hypothetical protein
MWISIGSVNSRQRADCVPKTQHELWPLLDAACRNTPAWLCQYTWAIAERFTYAALAAHGVGMERDGFRYTGGTKRKIDCNAVYRLIDHGLCWVLLEGKRLAIVTRQMMHMIALQTTSSNVSQLSAAPVSTHQLLDSF